MADFPNRLYELRTARKWSQQQLADRVGCSKMHISGMERGKRELSLPMMRRLADVFQVAPADLLSPVDNPDRLSDDEFDLLEIYRAADPAKRADILRVTEALVPFKHKELDVA